MNTNEVGVETTGFSVAEIQQELVNQEAAESNPWKNIVYLILSVLIFFRVGLMDSTVESALILVLVLFIHESGHWLGMKFYGYRDVKMFFIPFFGAAVSGKKTAISGAQSAIVSLLGPVPGIILGCVALYLYGRTQQRLWLDYAQTSLFLNVFNLLPLIPFDGGRVWESVVFCRHPVVEAIFKGVTTLAVLGLAYLLSSVALGVLGVFMLMTLRETYFLGNLAAQFRRSWREAMPEATDHIPDNYLEVMLPYISQAKGNAKQTVTTVASRALGVWMRLFQQPPKILASVGLLVLYFLFVGLGTGGWFVAAWWGSYKISVIPRTLPDQTTVWVQQRHRDHVLVGDTQLNAAGYYNGPAIYWNGNGIRDAEGTYVDGYREGTWYQYRPDGELDYVIEYDHSKPMKVTIYTDGTPKELPPDQWPASVKETIDRRRTTEKIP